jgi:ribonuclease R
MLPEKLSNNVCSLRPNEDRLTMSCIMDVDQDGKVHHYSIHEGVIRSCHRLIYEEVQAAMDGTAEPQIARSLGDIRLQLEMLYELRKILTDMRVRRGSLDLDIPETEIQFDMAGNVSGIVRRSRLESHRVVEECMLLANEVVASHLRGLKIPAVYRVHEEPDLDKLRQLIPVLAYLGVKFPSKREITADAIQAALKMAAKSETGFIARRMILRAMARARYSEENLGHYGLGSTCYTHFTSPIRRYPDLLVHRLVREAMANGTSMSGAYQPPVWGAHDAEVDHGGNGSPVSPDRFAFLKANMHSWAHHCSDREQRAEDIERDATKALSLEFMRKFLGEEFDGYVTSVTGFGMFIELQDLPVDGLIHLRNLPGDFYEFDDERMMLTGRETGRTFKLGDRVRVAVENVSVASMELDFALVQKYAPTGSLERSENINLARLARDRRYQDRRPRHKGFQSRGRSKRR